MTSSTTVSFDSLLSVVLSTSDPLSLVISAIFSISPLNPSSIEKVIVSDMSSHATSAPKSSTISDAFCEMIVAVVLSNVSPAGM